MMWRDMIYGGTALVGTVAVLETAKAFLGFWPAFIAAVMVLLAIAWLESDT